MSNTLDPAPKDSVAQWAAKLEPYLSDQSRGRLSQLIALIDTDSKIPYLDAYAALFPASAANKTAKTRADKTFKKFRDTLRLAAEDHGILFELKVDQRRNADPADRRFWFKTADDSVERITRFNEGVTQGLPAVLETQRVSVQSEGAEPGYLLIYARRDRDQALALHAALAGHLAAGGCDWRMSDWHAIPPGERQDLVRAGYLSKARLVLVLLSVHLIADLKRGTIALDTSYPLVPLALKKITPEQLEGTPIEGLTVFDGEGGDAWTPHKGSGRDDWAAGAAAKILSRIRAQSSLTPAKHDLFAIFERPRLRRVDDCEDAHFVPPFVKRDSDPEGRPAIDFLIDEWLLDADGDVFCAIFGELGMGKTTLCQHVTRDLLERRRTEPGLPLPVYLDLRAVNTMRWDWSDGAPPLESMLDHMIGTAFNIPVDQGRPGADEIKRLAQQQGGLILFDGLDEVMNRLTPEQCRGFICNLWSILPPTLWKPPPGAGPDWRRPAGVGRLIMTCRSHFFQTLHDQLNALDGQQRESVSGKDYLWVTLLPFTPEQVTAYFQQVFSADADQAERVIAMLDQIHDLRALSSRPYNLRLIQDQVDELEAIQRAGGTIGVADLYEGMVGRWVRRDEPKHRFNRDHKLLLMERLALRLWSRRQRDLSYQTLEDWLLDELLDEPRWQLEYSAYLNRQQGAGILKEDLRNATFIVREGEDRFRFAHTSIMEFFQARALHRALVEDRLDQWASPVPSPEALDFLGGLIATRETNACLDALARIRARYRHRISELALAYALRAHALGMPGAVFARFQLQGAELRFQRWHGRADRPMIWQGTDLSGARLDGGRFDDLDLSDARLDGANLRHSQLDHCRLDRLSATGAI